MKRYIRLKEHKPLSEEIGWPGETYSVDSSLERNRLFIVRADENGFIETGNDLGASTGSIVFLGDSVIENAMVDAHHRVRSHLKRAFSRNEVRIKVLNGGYSGATTLHVFNVLLNKIARIRLLAVSYVLESVDLRVCCRLEKYWSSRADVTPLVNDRDEDDQTDSQFDLKALIRMVELLAAVGRAIDVPVWFSTTPVQRDRNAEYLTRFADHVGEPASLFAKIDEVNDVKRRLFKNGVDPVFYIDRALVEPSRAFYNMSHYNQEESRRAAEAFLAEGLLDAVRAALP